MIRSDINFKDYLNNLKKNELINIINDYNKLCDIYGYTKIKDNTSKKDILVNLINDVKDEYIKAIIMSLDEIDYNIIKKLLKRCSIESLNNNRKLLNYLLDKHVLWQKDELEIPQDVKLNDLLKNKIIKKHINYWSNIYKLVDGIIIAYGVVDIDYFNKIIENINEKDNILNMLKFYYKNEYIIDDDKIISNKLTNKKRINNYYKNKKYKEFTIKEYIKLGNSIYHHDIKAYKKLIGILKNYYVFQKKDINYIDENIVIPYLYNKINEEDLAKNALEEIVVRLFEFKNDRLKIKMLKEIEKIKLDFPLWELRGYSIKERDCK